MSEMTSDRWRRIRLILDEALALPDDKQTSHVRSACRNDSVLCEEVLSWIQQRADADAEEFLEAFNHEGPADIHGTDAEGSVEGCDSTHDSNTTTGPRLADSSGKTDSTSPLPLASVGSGARFEIHREYARGGLGIVFLARDNELGREVALKQMQDRYLDSATARYRFMREAEITGRLEHPGVPPVYSFGQYADGRPYYAMKLVSGESMDKAIRLFHGLEAGKPDDSGKEGNRPSSEKRGKYTSFDFKQLLTHFASLCNTIDYAHSKGYIHRDIKPENIHLGKLGETIVLDWGLAKPLHEISAGTPETDSPDSNNRSTLDRGSHHSWTQYGDVFGTPAYMSPEQAAGQIDRIGPASDIFSLGCSLYCLLVGRPPLLRRKGEPPADLLAQLQDGRWQRPRTHNHHIPKPLEAICNRAMALAPEDRYSTAGGLAEDVERWLANEPTSVWTESPFERFIRWQRRYPGLRTGILVAAAIAVISLFGLSRLGANLSQARHGASLARQETRVESARHHATALARQAERGDWLGVIEGLNSPLLEAYDDKIALELWRIEALSALNRLEETEQAAKRLARLEVGAMHAGEVELWIGDVHRLRGEGDPMLRFHKAIQLGLPPAELAYAKSLVAETFPQSIEFAKEALRIKPFHHRANVLLVINLFLSGHLGEAHALARAARYMFPEDPNFPAALSMITTYQGNTESSKRHLARMTRLLGPESVGRFQKVIKSITRILNSTDDETGASSGLFENMPELITHGRAFWNPEDGGKIIPIQMPPQMQTFMAKLIMVQQVSSFSSVPGMAVEIDHEKSARAMAETARLLPLALFETLHGNALRKAGRIEESAKVLERATRAPALFAGTHRQSLALAISVHFQVYQRDRESEKGQAAREKAYAFLDAYLELGDPDPRILSTVASLLLEDDRHAFRGHQILGRACRQRPDDLKLANLLAWSHSLQGNHYRAWRLAGEVLEKNPKDERAARIRNEAGKQLEKWPSIDGSQPPQTCSQQRMIHAEVTSHLTSHQGD